MVCELNIQARHTRAPPFRIRAGENGAEGPSPLPVASIPVEKVAERVPALHRIVIGLANGAEGPSPLLVDNALD